MQRIRGRIVAARGAVCVVETSGGRVECVLRGILKKEKQAAVDPVAAGDWVEISVGVDGRGAIEAIEPRETKFSRPAPGRPHLEQVIVANASQLIVVQAAREPPLKVTSIDRYLVAAELGGLRPILCVNKMDLDKGGRSRSEMDVYPTLGIRVLYTCGLTGEGVGGLKGVLDGEVSVLVGPSGTGKTTLLNLMQPGLGLKVQEVSRKWSRGRHTTSWVELFPLEGGGYVADTPGLREVGLWGIGEPDLGEFFPEFEAFAGDCRYPTCTHSHEPDCRVARAVDEGRVSPARYRSYLRILKSLSGPD